MKKLYWGNISSCVTGDDRMHEIIDTAVFEEEDTQKGRFLTFSLDRESYGIEIKYVTEIIGIQAITEIQELPGICERANKPERQDNPRYGCKASFHKRA